MRLSSVLTLKEIVVTTSFLLSVSTFGQTISSLTLKGLLKAAHFSGSTGVFL
jgi:hypothetical protein